MLIVATYVNVLVSVSARTTTDDTTMETTGVRYRGCRRASEGGSCPASAMAKGIREMVSSPPLTVPSIEITAPTVIIVLPNGPRNVRAASASGRSEPASVGSVPTLTT